MATTRRAWRPNSPELLALVPALAALAVRAPSLWGSWAWDDLLIVRNQLPAFRTLRDLFFPPQGIPNLSPHYYRPFTIASYLVDRALWGENPLGFHLSLLLADAAAAALVFLLVRALVPPTTTGRYAALGGSLLFATHPVHTEAVSWIAGRADVLAAIGTLAACLLLVRRPLRGGAIAAAAGLFAAACLFKESAFGLLPLVPILAGRSHAAERFSPPFRLGGSDEAAGEERPIKAAPGRPLAAALAMVAAAAGVLALRWVAIGGAGGDVLREPAGTKVMGRLGGALWFYLVRTLVPLSPAPYIERIPGGVWVPAGFVLGAAVCVLGALSMRKETTRPFGLGLLMTVSFLAPALVPALFQVSTMPLAERYLYLPTVGLAVAVAGGLSFLSRQAAGPVLRPNDPGAGESEESRVAALVDGRWRRPGLALLVVATVALFGTLSWPRTGLWHDDLSLWTEASKRTTTAGPLIHLASALFDRGRHDEAEARYRDLLVRSNEMGLRDLALVHMNLGVILTSSGRTPASLGEFEETVRIDPLSSLGWYNLSRALWEMHRAGSAADNSGAQLLRRADAAASRASALAPFDPRALLIRAKIALALGRDIEARQLCADTVNLDPSGASGSEARRLLAVVR